VTVLQAMRTRCKNDRINNIGTKVPHSESFRQRIGHGRIGTFAGEGIGVRSSENSVWKKTTGHTGGQFRVRV